MTDPKDFYSSKINEYTLQLASAKRKSAYIAVARLTAFGILAVCLYLYFARHNPAFLFLFLLAAIVFIVLVRMSATLADRKKLTGKLLFINTNEAAVMQYGDNNFDDGSAIGPPAMHATDLDIFGKRSVYHLLNRTTTEVGSKSLSDLLNCPLNSATGIIEYQQALDTLSAQPDIRQLITAHGLLQDQNDSSVAGISEWIDTPVQIAQKKWVAVCRFLFPAIAVGGLLLYLSNGNKTVILAGILLNWLLSQKFGGYINRQHVLIGKKEPVLQQYGHILKLFSTADTGDSELLKKIKSTAENGRREMLSLSRLSAFLDQRLNLLVGFFLNILLAYDIHVMIAMENWKKRNRTHFMPWIDAVGDIEKLNSLATFRFNHPGYIEPAVREGLPFISATGISHPLIPATTQVANDITAGEDEKLLLITGSNMSGKSTFLRTIGVNVLLAQCGLPVCARSFSFSPMAILSSIRISDSLQENTSYFMAELKRLKEIIDRLAQGHPALVLIDEVLRGTNSDDKTYGSEELIKKLSACNCLSFFASHDLSLSLLENTVPGKIKNYCFESTIDNGELLFDYKLHSGVATNKNASFLMKKMGIIG